MTRGRCEGDAAELPLPRHGRSTSTQTGLTQGQEPPGLSPARPQLPPHTQLKQHWWNQHCGKNYACFYHCFGLPSPSRWIEFALSFALAPVLARLKGEQEMDWDLGETTKPTTQQQ